MKKFAFALSLIALGFVVALEASAQAPYGGTADRRMDAPLIAQAGAGGRGGSGAGGASGLGGQVAVRPGMACAGSAAVQRVRYNDLDRTAAPPPLDPTRKILTVSCTRPFDPAGGGNLCCS